MSLNACHIVVEAKSSFPFCNGCPLPAITLLATPTPVPHPHAPPSVHIAIRLCPTYPKLLVVPKAAQDQQLEEAARFRVNGRIPTVVWRSDMPGTLCRDQMCLYQSALHSMLYRVMAQCL